MHLITQLVLASNRNGQPLHVDTKESWTARPLLLGATQTLSYSCGLWVLAVIAAVLRGCHMTSLVEDHMGDLRRAILWHVIYL